jgi:hypothetical protein
MTYSIEIINDYDEFVLDDYPVMHEVDSGQAWFSTSSSNLTFGAHSNIQISVFNILFPYADRFSQTNFPSASSQINRANRLSRWAATSATNISWSRGAVYVAATNANDLLPDFVTTEKGDLSFFEMPSSGIVHALNYWVDAPQLTVPLKGGGIVIPTLDDTYTPNYVSVSTSILNTTPTGTYGLLVNDSSGNKILDSRLDLISLIDYNIFSASTIQSVLTTGTSVDFTPRNSITTPMVAMTKNVSVYSSGNGVWHYPLVTWDGSKFTMSRISRSTSRTFSVGVYQGFGMFVAESTA